jgi:hypothetical protein
MLGMPISANLHHRIGLGAIGDQAPALAHEAVADRADGVLLVVALEILGIDPDLRAFGDLQVHAIERAVDSSGDQQLLRRGARRLALAGRRAAREGQQQQK